MRSSLTVLLLLCLPACGRTLTPSSEDGRTDDDTVVRAGEEATGTGQISDPDLATPPAWRERSDAPLDGLARDERSPLGALVAPSVYLNPADGSLHVLAIDAATHEAVALHCAPEGAASACTRFTFSDVTGTGTAVSRGAMGRPAGVVTGPSGGAYVALAHGDALPIVVGSDAALSAISAPSIAYGTSGQDNVAAFSSPGGNFGRAAFLTPFPTGQTASEVRIQENTGLSFAYAALRGSELVVGHCGFSESPCAAPFVALEGATGRPAMILDGTGGLSAVVAKADGVHLAACDPGLMACSDRLLAGGTLANVEAIRFQGQLWVTGEAEGEIVLLRCSADACEPEALGAGKRALLTSLSASVLVLLETDAGLFAARRE